MVGMKPVLLSVLIVLFNLNLLAEVQTPYVDNDAFFKQSVRPKEIKIMSYNALNLYDTKHDEGFFDFTYLPKNHPEKMEQCETLDDGYYKDLCIELDWTEAKLKKKIKQLGKVIKGHGSLPDVLALQEVENEAVIKKLAQHLGYTKYIVTQFENRRGVDLALLYRTRALKFVADSIVKTRGRDTLKVQFKTKATNKNLFVYVNHWAAQIGPTFLRREAAEAIHEEINKVNEDFSNPYLVLVGDFNTSFSEEEEVFEGNFLDSHWDNHLVEAHPIAIKRNPEYKKYFPKGSYWRGKNSWQRYDRIFLSNNLMRNSSPVKAKIDSYRIIYSTMITGDYSYKIDQEDPDSDEVRLRYPLRYNFLEKEEYPLGYSDHLPTTIIIKN